MRNEPAELTPELQCEKEHEDDDGDGYGNRSCDLQRGSAEERHANQRQVDGHGEVFENKNGEDSRRLGIVDSLQLREHFGDHAG